MIQSLVTNLNFFCEKSNEIIVYYCNLPSYFEMLLLAFAFEEDNAHLEKIQAHGDPGMLDDSFPGGAHPFRPVDVIENKNGIVCRFLEALFEIMEGRFLAVVSIEPYKIQLVDALQRMGEGVVEIANNHLAVEAAVLE